MSTFFVGVVTINPFGATTRYTPLGTTEPGSPVKYTDTAQSYLNHGGFVRQVSNQNFYYTFHVFSKNAEYLGITLSMPLERDPIYC